MQALDAKAHAHIVLLAQTFYIQPLVCDSGVYVKCKSMCHISGGQHTWQSLEQYATPLHFAHCSTVRAVRGSHLAIHEPATCAVPFGNGAYPPDRRPSWIHPACVCDFRGIMGGPLAAVSRAARHERDSQVCSWCYGSGLFCPVAGLFAGLF